MRGGDGGRGVVPNPGPALGPGLDPEQGLTDGVPAPNGQLLESNLRRGRSAEGDGGRGRVAVLVVRDEGFREALAALKMVCLQKVPLNAKAGRRILTGLQKRLVKPRARKTLASVAALAGKTGTGGRHGVVEGLNVAEAPGGAVATAASTISRRKRLTTAGSPETASQVQATIQGTTHTAATMKTGVVAGGKTLSRATRCTIGQDGHPHPAGLSGGRYLLTFRTTTQRGREEDQEAGTESRRSSSNSQDQQIPPKVMHLPRRSQVMPRCL